MLPLRRRTLLVNLGIGAVIVVAVTAAAGALVGPAGVEAEPTTADVQRGTVISTVAAAGEVVSRGDVDVDFSIPGRVVEVLVDVGDRVVADQVLARLDDTPLREQLEVAEAAQHAARASRSQLAAGRTTAQRRLLDLERQQALLQLQHARAALELAEDQRDAAVQVYEQQVDAAERTFRRARDFLDEIESELDCDSPDPATELQTCLQASDRVGEARSARDAARRGRDQARVREEQALAGVRDQVRLAELGLELADARIAVETAPPGQGDTAQLDAEVVRTRVLVAQAERDLDDAVLRAPADGVVAVVGARVGATVSGPGAGAIVLTDVEGREVSAAFAEADATRIEPGQAAVVTFDALPGVSVNGRVLRVDPLPTLTGNLVRYGVRIEVDALPDQVRIGQTTTVEVLVGEADDVLYVPTTAVSTVGTRTTVTVFDGEQSVVRDVVVGLRGDQYLEITSGVSEGERVVLPTRGAGTLPDIFGPGGAGEPSTEPARAD